MQRGQVAVFVTLGHRSAGCMGSQHSIDGLDAVGRRRRAAEERNRVAALQAEGSGRRAIRPGSGRGAGHGQPRAAAQRLGERADRTGVAEGSHLLEWLQAAVWARRRACRRRHRPPGRGRDAGADRRVAEVQVRPAACFDRDGPPSSIVRLHSQTQPECGQAPVRSADGAKRGVAESEQLAQSSRHGSAPSRGSAESGT